MKIRCVSNEKSLVPTNISGLFFRTTIGVEVDQEYVVYGITEYYGYIWYCLLDKFSDTYPIWLPSDFFEIVDPRLSKFWIFSFLNASAPLPIPIPNGPFIGFPEWAKDVNFYDNLVEGEELEISLFEKYRKAMDLEFPDSSVTESAQIGDEEWLQCPKCIDAWECSNNKDALVICPKCTQRYNNPRYKNEMPAPK